MTKLANDLIEAKALIADPKEWCKGIDPKGRSRCAMYAIADVAAPDIHGTRYSAMERALHAAQSSGEATTVATAKSAFVVFICQLLW